VVRDHRGPVSSFDRRAAGNYVRDATLPRQHHANASGREIPAAEPGGRGLSEMRNGEGQSTKKATPVPNLGAAFFDWGDQGNFAPINRESERGSHDLKRKTRHTAQAACRGDQE
jgi:hypothetical protein